MAEYDSYNHISVLLNESLEYLNIKKDGKYLDCTLGGGGHSGEILKRIPDGFLYAVDQDEYAIEKATEHLNTIGKNYKIVKTNFEFIDSINEEFDGILYDLGVSSFQFDDSDRGFSYRFDAPLDMRMNLDNSFSAKDLVNIYPIDELCRVFREYGEEKFAYQIARNIIKFRETKSIDTTFELVDIIKKSLPAKELRKPGHPAKQVFQAIRIEVNDELNVLRQTLGFATGVLAPKGRLAVITFHSGEDKIVKSYFKSLSVIEGNRLDIPDPDKTSDFLLVNTKAIMPSENEIEINHRSISAKLRIIERK